MEGEDEKWLDIEREEKSDGGFFWRKSVGILSEREECEMGD